MTVFATLIIAVVVLAGVAIAASVPHLYRDREYQDDSDDDQ